MNTVVNKKVFTELNSIRLVARDLYKQKKLTYVIQKKYITNQKRLSEKSSLSKREELQEKSKPNQIKKFLTEEVQKKSLGIYDLLKFLITYKVVEWIANPKNLAAVQNIVKAIAGIAKVVNFFAGIGVEGVFGGLHSILFGGSILERIFGVFKLMGGIFILRRILRPQQLLKDLQWIFKNRNGILGIFKNLRIGEFTKAIQGIFKVFTPNLFSIFKKGLGTSVRRVIIKVFGKGGIKFLTGVAAKLGFKSAELLLKGTLKVGVPSLAKGIPLVGPIIGLVINLLLGDPLDKALVKLAGTIAGQAIGGLLMGILGSVVPVAGTAAGAAVGAAIGGLIGDMLGGMLYDGLKGMITPKKEPALAVGGIVTRPTRALIGEAGPEAVIPLPQLFGGSVFNSTFAVMGSSIIGGVNAVLSSMGPIGGVLRPFATQLFAPYNREFGEKQYVFNSDIGKSGATKLGNLTPSNTKEDAELTKIVGKNNPRLLNAKENNPKARYNTGNTVIALLGDIFNSIMNLDFSAPDTGKGTGGGSPSSTGDAQDASGVPGADHQEKAFNYFVKLGLSKEHAAGIVGNLMIESYPDIRPNADNGGHHGIAQWDKKHRWPALVSWATNNNKDPNKFETQLEYLSIESGYLKKFKSISVSSADHATQEWEELFERSGGQALDTRKKNARSVLQKYAKMKTGGVVNPIPSQNIGTNKGGYAADTGLDILSPIGSRVVSPVSGIIEYAEKGHVRQMGQDANPNMPGMQDQHSIRIKLDTPFKFAGKQVNFFYATHLYQLNPSIANKSGVKINAGDLLGLSGVANNVPHVHVGFVEDRNQNSFLNYQQVRSLLSGAPVQDAGQSPGGPDVPSGSDTQQDTEKPADWNVIAKELGDLYKSLTGVQKVDVNSLSSGSMNLVQSKNITPVAFSDTYIIGQGSTTVANVNVINPLTQPDYGTNSFSRFDTSSNYLAQSRL